MHTKILLVPAIALVLGLAHAEPALTAPADSSAERDRAEQNVKVRVVNHNWADMRIYAIVKGRSFRLGTVTSLTTETFKIRRGVIGLVSDVELVAVGIGSRATAHSGSIEVFPGDHLEFRVENGISTSFVTRM